MKLFINYIDKIDFGFFDNDFKMVFKTMTIEYEPKELYNFLYRQELLPVGYVSALSDNIEWYMEDLIRDMVRRCEHEFFIAKDPNVLFNCMAGNLVNYFDGYYASVIFNLSQLITITFPQDKQKMLQIE